MPVIPVENLRSGKVNSGHGAETDTAQIAVQRCAFGTTRGEWSHLWLCDNMPQPARETTCKMTTTRRKRMTRLSGMIDGMMAPSVQKRGFVISRLVSEWPMIAGDMASWSRPSQMNLPRSGTGTLKLAIASGFGPVALQMKGAIIERVNAAFGYRAVSEVVFVQTLPPPRGDSRNAPPASSPGQRAKATWALDAKLEKVKSPELRAALRRLGSAD